MPPKTRERPPQPQVEAAARSLGRDLHAASLARQRAEGRAVLRRLNNTEYENTIRELVGTNVALRDLLPEENSTAGFDNVGTALDLSSTHLLRYQEAAERAVCDAPEGARVIERFLSLADERWAQSVAAPRRDRPER